MKTTKHYIPFNYIIVALFAAFIGIFMIFINIHTESIRQSESDYSEGWLFDGNTVDLDSVVTKGTSVSVSKNLPENINYNDSLCFASANAIFDVYIGDELVYRYTQPSNFTGDGYGIAYHNINLSSEQAGKTVRIDFTSAFSIGTSGKIRLISIENSQKYFSRLARGQILPFIVSTGILIIGVLLFLFSILFYNSRYKARTISLSLAATDIGIMMALDTGFLRITTDSILLSRNLFYLSMHLSVLPIAIFLYTMTKERKKCYRNIFYLFSIIYFAFIIISRFAFNIDMASRLIIRSFFIYTIVMMIIIFVMISSDLKYRKATNRNKDNGIFFFGIISTFICIMTDIIIYMSGYRSMSGYSTFTRVGFYAFFICMSIEIVRTWAHEYNSLKKFGFTDELTGLGNRRSHIRFEK
nr:hypothetical protein [Butyrivibrio sp.]